LYKLPYNIHLFAVYDKDDDRTQNDVDVDVNDITITEENANNTTINETSTTDKVNLNGVHDIASVSLSKQSTAEEVYTIRSSLLSKKNSTTNTRSNTSTGSTVSPVSGLSSDDDGCRIKRDGRPVLQKQLSIKEYRLKKLQRETTLETSDEDLKGKIDQDGVDFSTVSSLAEVSDTSVGDLISRNKRYSHSKRDVRDAGVESSSSESDNPLQRKSAGHRVTEKLNRLYEQNAKNHGLAPRRTSDSSYSYRPSMLSSLPLYSNSIKSTLSSRNWHSSNEMDADEQGRRKRYSRRDYKSLDGI